ncbi:MAG: hypothetical protein ABSE28_24620 [Candidatus Sulfotelmatobacter sp.]|jgi:hypothetical protein
MANFFFTGGRGGEQAINLDQVRLANHETVTGRVTVYFEPEHTIILEGEVAKQFMGVLGGLRSEAKALSGEAAVKRSNSAVGALKKRKKQS